MASFVSSVSVRWYKCLDVQFFVVPALASWSAVVRKTCMNSSDVETRGMFA